MVNLPQGYSEDDCTQHGLSIIARRSEVDVRSPFQHDVDRILYSGEFRALAAKTQVVASDQLGGYHNRLTHSLKVAQVGKRLAVLLTEHARADGVSDVGPDPDLVEAACLMHDIGHAPFGHVGEVEVARGLDLLWGERESEPSARASLGRHPDGFQANAQNLRIATYLSVRLNVDPRGLHLTRACLDAATKYPWHRGGQDTYSGKAWGCYKTEDQALAWVLPTGDPAVPIRPAPEDKAGAPRRPVEEQIMDWADDVTYACHDVDDFYRAGLIPLDAVLVGLPSAQIDPRPGVSREVGYETRRFLEYVKDEQGEADDQPIIEALLRVANSIGQVFPYEDTQAVRGTAAGTTSSLLAYFLGKRNPEEQESGARRKVQLELLGDSNTLTRYGAQLYVAPEVRKTCDVLNALIKCYVINRPGLATQQEGQRRVLRDLLAWYANDPKRLLPEARREEYMAHGDALRAAADAVSGLTEAAAVRIHRRMSGIDYGQVTDLR